MLIKQCGRTGLRVSDIGLGTMTWGRDTDGVEAAEMLSRFVDSGGSLVEASPLHGDGMATQALADAISRVGRHRVVLAWRGAARPIEGHWVPSGARGDMLRSLDDSLARLGTDHVDVWLAQPDPTVPLTETLEALEAARRSGRAHYVGLSHPSTWELAEAAVRAELGSGVLAVVEDEFSLLCHDRADEVLAPLGARGIGFFGHSPLAAGVLTGKYRHSTPPDSRAASAHLHGLVERFSAASDRGVVEAVVRAAEGLDRTPAGVALAWARDLPGVSSVIIGPRTARQLDQLLDGADPLPAPIRQVLDEVSAR